MEDCGAMSAQEEYTDYFIRAYILSFPPAVQGTDAHFGICTDVTRGKIVCNVFFVFFSASASSFCTKDNETRHQKHMLALVNIVSDHLR